MIKKRIAIVEAALNSLSEAGIRYGIINGALNYPSSLGRDVDVIVNSQDQKTASSVVATTLKNNGFDIKIQKTTWGPILCYGYKCEDGLIWGVEIDLISTYLWAGCLLKEGVCEDDELYRVGGITIDLWGAFVKSILIQILSRNSAKALRNAAIGAHIWKTEANAQIIKRKLQRLYGAHLAASLYSAICEADSTSIKRMTSILPKKTLGHFYSIRHVISTIPGLIRWAFWRLSLLTTSSRSGPVIAIVGPDGVGKSTLINYIAENSKSNFVFSHTHLKHWRAGILPALGILLGRRSAQTSSSSQAPRRSAGRLSTLRALYYWFDFLLGHFIKDRGASIRSELTLYDRFWGDMIVDPLRFGIRDPLPMNRLFRLLPAPDLILLLEDSAQAIIQRKAELKAVEIDEMYKRWKILLKKLPRHAILDASQGKHRVNQQAEELIIRAFLNKS